MHRLLIVSLASFALAACSDEASEPVDTADPSIDEAAWAEGYQSAEQAKADGSGCSGVTPPDSGDFGGMIALTFDDGPKPGPTNDIIEVLKDHEAPATFFLLGKAIAAHPTLAKEIADDPLFIAAHHSWSHPQLSRTDNLTYELDRPLEEFSKIGVTPTFLRPPYGALNCRAKQAIEDRGMRVVGWHIDSADWAYASGNGTARWDGVPSEFKSDMIGYIVRQTARNNGGIMLFHDIKTYTADVLDEVLEKLETLGYTFVALDDASVFPRLNGIEPPPEPFIGEACEEDADCVFSAGGKSGYCFQSTVCVIDCAGPCPDKSGTAPTFCIADPREGIEGGICVSQAAEINEFCDAAPNTVKQDAERYVGSSGASVRNATVCAPALIE